MELSLTFVSVYVINNTGLDDWIIRNYSLNDNSLYAMNKYTLLFVYGYYHKKNMLNGGCLLHIW